MPVLTVLLYIAIFIVALLLIVLILIQPSKSGGMGAAFGGIGESVFGGKAGSHLTKTTVIMTAIFFVIALVLAAVIGLGNSEDSVREALAEGTKTEEKAGVTQNAASEAPSKDSSATEKAK